MNNKIITADSTVSKIKEVVASDMDGETVMMSIENGKYYGMDTIGSRIWELMEHQVKVSHLLDILLKEFAVDRETCEKDTLKFLNHLGDENVIKVD